MCKLAGNKIVYQLYRYKFQIFGIIFTGTSGLSFLEVIFITENPFFYNGIPLWRFERYTASNKKYIYSI